MDLTDHPLDNPIWNALSTRQSYLNDGDEVVKVCAMDVSPFVAVAHFTDDEVTEMVRRLPSGCESAFVVRKEVSFPSDDVELLLSIPIHQMTLTNDLQPCRLREDLRDQVTIRPLTVDDVPAMLQLTEATKPGPFRERTIEFGAFTGVFVDGTLVAMAGHRMKVPGYSEVSAICTSPDHLGKGFASVLTTMVCEEILRDHCVPFLHVRTGNLRARAVYEKLGFSVRTDLTYYVFRKK
jgi:ribosomal protein S18 acetylase RimI-like enzyme